MVNIGKADGRKIMALITNMDAPLGYAIGNSLEVIEAINTLRGNGPEDLTNLCVELAAHMLFLSGKGSVDVCKGLVRETIQNTSALQKLAQTVEADDLIHAVQEFRPQEVLQCLHDSLPALVISAAAEANCTGGFSVGPCI